MPYKRKYAKKSKKTVKVSAPVKKYVKKVVANEAKEEKAYVLSGSGVLNNTGSSYFQYINDVGIIPRYDATSTTVQEGSLAQSRVKNEIKLNEIVFKLFLKNNSTFNQFIRVVIFRNSSINEQFSLTGSNLMQDSAGTETSISTELLQGQRLQFNTDLIVKNSDMIFDRVYPLPYDSSYEGGSLPISYIRTIRIPKKIRQRIIYERAPDDVSGVSPRGGRWYIAFWAMHGQGVSGNNCPIAFEWLLGQYYEE